MQIIEGTVDFHIQESCAVAIGKFDGIHRGHQKLMKEILFKKQEGLCTAVFTFDKSPQSLFGFGDGKVLTTKEEKREQLRKLGIDYLVEFPLTLETAQIEPEAFIKEILVKQMNAKFIAAGMDVSYGNKGKGNAELLQTLAKECGFEVELIEKVCDHGTQISSTLVRKKVEDGEMEEVRALLGEPYQIRGIVEKGKQIGRTIDFPTVNLFPAEEKLLPPNGVYCTEVAYAGKIYHGVTNVGYRPTVSDNTKISVETYIFEFDQQLYGEYITVFFHHYLRKECKFDGLEALKAQIKKDQMETWKYYERR